MENKITDSIIIDRFLSRIDQKSSDECWPWLGGTTPSNRGMMRVDGQQTNVYRISFRIFCGEIEANKVIMHKCDNPNCVNPSHLIKGTQQDNVNDMYAKNRQRHTPSIGSNNGRAVLNEINVKDIKDLLRQGYSQSEIARMYEVTPRTICAINAGTLWAHVRID